MPTIQNRSVIFSSSQPPSSKWWCSGAIRNTRLPPDGFAELDHLILGLARNLAMTFVVVTHGCRAFMPSPIA